MLGIVVEKARQVKSILYIPLSFKFRSEAKFQGGISAEFPNIHPFTCIKFYFCFGEN